jgi:YesN/AraC family two-component response regulator
VLSDINMPLMTGLELLADVRSRFNAVPFVVLTGFGDSSSLREAIRLNATDFLEKPFKAAELLEVMSRAVEYGLELLRVETQLRDALGQNSLSKEKVDELIKARRTVALMRIENSIYVKDRK